MLQERMFKCLSFVETPHDHEPVGDRSVSVNRQPTRRCGERQHIEIDIGRKSTIQAELGPARSFTSIQG
jgi:hypothetical protein